MAVTEGFKDFVRDLFADFGPVTIRNMFGGAGVYADGVMFAILADDTLYLKTDAVSAFAYASESMTALKYTQRGREKVAMPYWEVPPRLLEEPKELAAWARVAHRIARASKTTPKRKHAGSRTGRAPVA